jgi:hypothetical protein
MELETPVVPVPHPRGPLGLQTRESAGGQAVKKRRKYRVWDLGGEEIIHARNAREAAEKFAEGFFDDPPDPEEGTCFAKVNVQEIEDEDDPYPEVFVNSVYIPIDPPEPECEYKSGHRWEAPHEVVGGLKENPGVFGHGGGEIIYRVCSRCGMYRIVDTWPDRVPDHHRNEPGARTIRYAPPDERSLEWVQSRRSRRR